MKCVVCGAEIEGELTDCICDECIETKLELSNGKEESENGFYKFTSS